MPFRRPASHRPRGLYVVFRRLAVPRRFDIALVAPQALVVLTLAFALHPLVAACMALIAYHLTRALRAGWHSVYSVEPRSDRHLHLGLWPFFAWWVACTAFVLLAPLALVAMLFGVSGKLALGVVGASAVAIGLHGIRRTPRIRRVTLRFPHLPPAFDGYRIAQLSDIHCGPFAPERRVARWVRRTQRLRADLIAVTGDLVASGSAYVEAVGRALQGLRAPDGVYACMGNHDYFGAGERLVRALEAGGLRVLRNAATGIERAGARLRLAGVDDTWVGRADVGRALAGSSPADFTVLLAHDPDVFPRAAAHGADLTLSGHTHGGQLGVPFSRAWNLARLVTPFTAGLYRQGASVLYVNRGIGTTGPPVRLGARAEIALITLRCG
jgi:predicted MPP superfamily phosphohydrolase